MRLIVDEPADGSWNMAVDEALLASAASSERPTLRFYGWSQATLSLGYFQRLGERQGHTGSGDCPVVRRATGGGAILHHREITYSYAAPLRDRFAPSASGVYHLLHDALIEILAAMGVQAHTFRGPSPAVDCEPPFLCFQRRSEHDVMVSGAKVAGSAQRRRHGALLQHGSLLLASSPHAPELAGLAELTGRQLAATELTGRWSEAVAGRLELRIEAAERSADEEKAARAIATAKYGQASWTERR